jgi:hypothetical protein
MAKSDPLGGHRTGTRHATELTISAAAALLMVSFIPEGWVDPFQSNLISVIGTGAFSTIAKFTDQAGVGGRILAKIGKSSIVLLLLGTGCAIQLGTVKPEQFNSPMGDTIVACSVTGVSLALGDADVCRTVSGGHASKQFTNMVGDIVNGVFRAVGGFFGGLGAALTPAPRVEVEEEIQIGHIIQ